MSAPWVQAVPAGGHLVHLVDTMLGGHDLHTDSAPYRLRSTPILKGLRNT